MLSSVYIEGKIYKHGLSYTHHSYVHEYSAVPFYCSLRSSSWLHVYHGLQFVDLKCLFCWWYMYTHCSSLLLSQCSWQHVTNWEWNCHNLRCSLCFANHCECIAKRIELHVTPSWTSSTTSKSTKHSTQSKLLITATPFLPLANSKVPAVCLVISNMNWAACSQLVEQVDEVFCTQCSLLPLLVTDAGMTKGL